MSEHLGSRAYDDQLLCQWKLRLRGKQLSKVTQQVAESEVGPSVTAVRHLSPHCPLPHSGHKETPGPSLQNVIGFGWVRSN